MLWDNIPTTSGAALLIHEVKLALNLFAEDILMSLNHSLGNFGVEFLEEAHSENVIFLKGGCQYGMAH